MEAASECWSVGRGTTLTDQRNDWSSKYTRGKPEHYALLLAKTAEEQLGNNYLNVLEWSPDLNQVKTLSPLLLAIH